MSGAVLAARTQQSSPADCRRFGQVAWGVLAYNILVVLWGAFVRATGSGAGCGDRWPLCNGVMVPRAPRIETIIEFTHRATSGLSLLTVAVTNTRVPQTIGDDQPAPGTSACHATLAV